MDIVIRNHAFCKADNKQLLDEVFVISGIINKEEKQKKKK